MDSPHVFVEGGYGLETLNFWLKIGVHTIEIPTNPENTTYNNTSMKIHHADDYFYNVNLFMMKQPLL